MDRASAAGQMESTVLPNRASSAKLLIPLLIGAAVALGLGIYGNEHDPTGRSIFSLVFTKTINMKAWFATAAGVVALFQAVSELSIYRVVPVPSKSAVREAESPARRPRRAAGRR